MYIIAIENQTSEAVISVLKELFAQHGIPDLVVSDNGPQYSAEIFQNSQLPRDSYTRLVAPSIHSLMERLRELYALLKQS